MQNEETSIVEATFDQQPEPAGCVYRPHCPLVLLADAIHRPLSSIALAADQASQTVEAAAIVTIPVEATPTIKVETTIDNVPSGSARASSPVKVEHKFLSRPSYPSFSVPRPNPVAVNPASYRGSLPAQYPDPPPPSDPLGPAAQPPYLSGDQYSCRPGGPRLFDLLNYLPLEPFGVLSWMIVDREEEIYELDDVADKDKVMLALWNRWIFLNR